MIIDIFSKKQKRLRGEVPDIFTYDTVPKELRVQIIHIMRDVFSTVISGVIYPEKAYTFIHDTLCREYGLFALDDYRNEEENLIHFFLNEKEVDKVLDVIDLAFRYMYVVIKPKIESPTAWYHGNKKGVEPERGIEELNRRFKEHGVGYQFEGGEIIRVDSTYIHSEITKPVLTLLGNKKFAGANEEYLTAHEHYRHGRNKECLTECLKAFESTLKTICAEKGWAITSKDTAQKLIQLCFTNGLVPTFTQNQFTSLQSLLESGIPAIRNKLGGHGQGQTPQKVDDEMTRYGLNLTGTNIIFLIEQSGIK